MDTNTARDADHGNFEIPDDLIESRHAARLARAHISTIHRWVNIGAIRGVRRGPGRRLFVSRADVMKQMEPVLVKVKAKDEHTDTHTRTGRKRDVGAEIWTREFLRKEGIAVGKSPR